MLILIRGIIGRLGYNYYKTIFAFYKSKIYRLYYGILYKNIVGGYTLTLEAPHPRYILGKWVTWTGSDEARSHTYGIV